jgi:hypothetical protein
VLLVAFSLPIGEWLTSRPPVSPLAWAALRVSDDLAYQAGLWSGAIEKRSFDALLPRF